MSDRIIVTSQAEMDKVPQGYDGIVEVRSNPGVWIGVPSGLYVCAYGSSQVVAHGSSQVEAYDSSQVRAYDSSRVVAYGYSQVRAYDSSRVVTYGSSQVVAYGYSQVRAYDSSRVVAYGSSQVVAHGSSQVRAYGYSQVRAYGSSRVVACDSSWVRAYDSSRVDARGCAQILRLSRQANLTVAGNARVVEPPKTAREYANYYGVEVRDGSAILYKVVDANLRSFFDRSTQYVVGETLTQECDPSQDVACSTGLHVAYKDWAIRFGMERSSDFRLLEVAVPLDKIVVPTNTDGKVRTSELTVLREVPREEWGFYSTWRM